MNHYDHGDAPLATVTFTDLDSAPADPTTVTFRLRSPDGTTTVTTHPASAIDNPTVGTFTYQLNALDQEGRWSIRCEGTGALTAAAETTFIVRDSAFS